MQDLGFFEFPGIGLPETLKPFFNEPLFHSSTTTGQSSQALKADPRSFKLLRKAKAMSSGFARHYAVLFELI